MRPLLYAALLFVFADVPTFAQQSPPDTRTSLLTIRVNTAYDDSDDSVALIQTIVTKLPTTRAVLEHGTTLSQFVVQQYGFGPSDLPRSYAVVERAILSENHWDKPEQAKAGSISIPLLPRRALTMFNHRKTLNSVPKLWVFGDMRAKTAEAREAQDFSFTSAIRLDQNRRAAQSELINVPLPLSSVDQLMTDPILARYGSAFDYPISVQLASGPGCQTEFLDDDHRTLTDEERKSISQLLSQNNQRDGFVFILDTGWPNKKAYEESREQLWTFLDSFWRRNFGLGLPHGPYSQQYADPGNFHCRCVERSLREFRQLDPGQHVKVIYVPLTREQDGGSVITDLLQTSYLYEWEHENHVLPPNDVLKTSRQFAEDTVSKKFPSQWSGDEVTTDKSLLDAIMLLSDEYAGMRNTFFFVNESWTVNHKEYYIRWPTPFHGAVVAATGNAEANVSDPMLDFADRASLTKDTIAVMNLDSVSGTVCSSSFIDERDIDTAMAIGYDGKISTDICGTSFAAPRVAWVLAADEATRKNTVEPQRWAVTLQGRLSSIRSPSSKQYLKLWLHPGKLLALPH